MRTFWKITFPLLLPGILAAALLSFALSIDDFIITLFNAGEVSTFPLYINASFRNSFSPQINVLATMILIFATFLMVIGTIRTFRADRRAGG
jgi:spermidine/putrescine transport system permease protein